MSAHFKAQLIYAPVPPIHLDLGELPDDSYLPSCYLGVFGVAKIHYTLDRVMLHDDANVAIYLGEEILPPAPPDPFDRGPYQPI
jgi:hypothetical protein